MKKLILSILAVTIIAMPLTACNNKLGKGLTEYTIIASLNEQEKTVTADMRVDFVNDTESELSELAFHLYGNAYRQDAKHN